MNFKNIFDKKAHFYEWSSRPNVEKILLLLNEEKILNISFNLSEWRNYTEIIIKQLREVYNELKKDSYLDLKLTFILWLKDELNNLSNFEKNNFFNVLFSNWIEDKYKKIIKKVYKYNNINNYIENILKTTIYNSLHLQEHNIYFENNKDILDTYRYLSNFIDKINRIDNFFRDDLVYLLKKIKRWDSRSLSQKIKIEEIDKYIQEIEESTDLFKIFEIIDTLNNKKYILENKFFKRFVFELDHLFFEKWELDNNISLKNLFNEEIDILNQKLSLLKEEDIKVELDELLNNRNINFYIQLSEFIPAFISRIDIIEEWEKKRTFIEKFEIRKNNKKRLSALYLLLSILIFWLIIFYNYTVYLANISSSKTLIDFIHIFLWRNIYLFSIELLLIILGFYFLWLFKTYSKIVELYDSHILLIESDFYYKDDKDLNMYNLATFELRKENTQKIHSLPEKTYSILNWKWEIKTELPTIKIWENIWKILNSLVDKLSNKK